MSLSWQQFPLNFISVSSTPTSTTFTCISHIQSRNLCHPLQSFSKKGLDTNISFLPSTLIYSSRSISGFYFPLFSTMSITLCHFNSKQQSCAVDQFSHTQCSVPNKFEMEASIHIGWVILKTMSYAPVLSIRGLTYKGSMAEYSLLACECVYSRVSIDAQMRLPIFCLSSDKKANTGIISRSLKRSIKLMQWGTAHPTGYTRTCYQGRNICQDKISTKAPICVKSWS